MRKIYSLLIMLILLISTTSIVLGDAGEDKGNHYGKGSRNKTAAT